MSHTFSSIRRKSRVGLLLLALAAIALGTGLPIRPPLAPGMPPGPISPPRSSPRPTRRR